MQNTTAPTSAPLTLEQVPRAVSDIIERLDRIEEKLQDPQTEKKQDLEAGEDGVIWLTVPELCAYLPDHPAKPTVYGWVYDKLIPYYKRSKKLLFRKDEIDIWAGARRTPTAQEIQTEAIDYVNSRRMK